MLCFILPSLLPSSSVPVAPVLAVTEAELGDEPQAISMIQAPLDHSWDVRWQRSLTFGGKIIH